jgi:ATP-binding protein involved in chromosome partitioning
MAARAGLRVSGVIENMGSFECPCCGEQTAIFGDGGGESVAEALAAPLLASIPVTVALRASGDAGTPLVVSAPEAPASRAFLKAARRLLVLARPHPRVPLIVDSEPVGVCAAGPSVQGRSER